MTEQELQEIETLAKGCLNPKAGWARTHIRLVAEVRRLRNGWSNLAEFSAEQSGRIADMLAGHSPDKGQGHE